MLGFEGSGIFLGWLNGSSVVDLEVRDMLTGPSALYAATADLVALLPALLASSDSRCCWSAFFSVAGEDETLVIGLVAPRSGVGCWRLEI